MTFKSILFLLLVSCNLQGQISIDDRINKIDNIIVSEIIAKDGFSACYKIMIRQPINHSDTTEGFFYQKVFLSHKSVDKPMVMNVNGYISFSNKTSDWTKVLDANQIYIEHRFFGESRPGIIDYEHLNIANATKDLHKVKEVFGAIYQNGWISVGISKGGLTALSYRYFFPNDVDATIALSTSVKTSRCDLGFFHYIDSLNIAHGCKEELEDFQELLLTRKSDILPHLENYLLSEGKEYSRLGLKTIYEIGVLEMPFSIWQNGKGCNSIEYNHTNSKELFDALQSSLNGWFMTDDIFNLIDPYHFQALTELGHYCYPTKRFSNLLETDLDKLTPVQPVIGVATTYSNKLMIQIKAWAQNSGDQIIYISGGNDPYSKHRITPNINLDSKSFLLKDKNHNQVFSTHMDTSTLNEITNLISKWTKK